MKKTYIKSPLNYTGGKFKLLPQLVEVFPKKIDTFVDLFTGGANVAVNVEAKNVQAYDINGYLIELYTYFSNHTYEKVVSGIESIVAFYGLSDSTKNGYNYYGCESSKGLGSYNKEKYMKLRDDYNNDTQKFPKELLFFSLIIFGFNNQIRFNRSGKFNMPVGKRDFNKNIRSNLEKFMNSLHAKNIHFSMKDFRSLDVEKLKKGDFVYCDPPYLITTATYNEQDGWTEKDEKDLLHLLDTLHKKEVLFALSNVMEKGEKKNEILIKWAKKYTIHDLNFHYKNSNYHKKDKKVEEREVLITNY